MMRRIVVSGCFVLAIILSVIFERDLFDKQYITISFSLALSLYWLCETAMDYISFRNAFVERFRVYKAEIVNKTGQNIEKLDDKVHYKKFKRSIWKENFLQISKPLIFFGLIVAFIFALAI